MIDARRTEPEPDSGEFRCEDSTLGGRKPTGLDAVEWTQRAAAHGARELLLTSRDADGRRSVCGNPRSEESDQLRNSRTPGDRPNPYWQYGQSCCHVGNKTLAASAPSDPQAVHIIIHKLTTSLDNKSFFPCQLPVRATKNFAALGNRLAPAPPSAVSWVRRRRKKAGGPTPPTFLGV